MAKQNAAGLLGALKDDTHLKPVQTAAQKAGNGKRLITEGESLLSANLPVAYPRTLALIAAEEGTTRKALMIEALNMLFQARGRAVPVPTVKM